MFKLVVFVAIMAVACAAPGGLTGHIVDHGLGHIHAPNIITHGATHHVSVVAQAASAPVHSPAISLHAAPLHHPVPLIVQAEPHHVVPHYQPLAPVVDTVPIVTKTVLPGHDHYVPVHSLH